MSPREMQLLVSLIEDEYEDTYNPSLSATIAQVLAEIRTNNPTDEELFQFLRRKHGSASGRIARNVSKRLFEHLSRTNSTVAETISNAAEFYNCKQNEISDDRLYRYLNQAEQ